MLTLLFSDGTHETVSLLSVIAPPGVTKNAKSGAFAGTTYSPVLRIQFTSLRQDFLVVLGQPTTVEVKVVDDCEILGRRVEPGRSRSDRKFFES